MVLALLYLKAELEDVSSITLRRDQNLCLSVRNPLSDYEVRDKVVMNPAETVEQEEGLREPPHHFGLKWEGSKKTSTLIVLDEKEAKSAIKSKKKKGSDELQPRDYTGEDSGSWVPILAVACRGLEPIAFFPLGDDFTVTSSGGTHFASDIDFSEGDWADYDEENDAAVSVSEIEFKWEML